MIVHIAPVTVKPAPGGKKVEKDVPKKVEKLFVKVENGVYNTGGNYLKETVSYGSSDLTLFADGTKVEFSENEPKNVTRTMNTI